MFVKKTNGYVIRNNRISTTKFLQALLVDWITDANVHFLNWVVSWRRKVVCTMQEYVGEGLRKT